MKDEPANPGGPAAGAPRAQGLPAVVGRADFEAERAGFLARENAHTREGDAIASLGPWKLVARWHPGWADGF